MTASHLTADAVVIGGGFYGSVIAIYLARQRRLRRVLLIEQASQLFAHASYNNQARVHNGYHYPRSLITAYRSRINLPRFVRDWPQTINKDFVTLYAIARRNSKTTAKQFERFCHEIGATLSQADPALRALFEPRMIEQVYVAEEYAFDAARLARCAEQELSDAGVQVHFHNRATAISRSSDGDVRVVLQTQSGAEEEINCRYLFNCSYSGLSQFGGDFPGTQSYLKHEITELALMAVPPVLRDIGITVMDGPFFSLMPFPARGLHTLSHVRYTPHLSWKDERGINPYQKLAEYNCITRVDRMVRDVARYLPAIADAKYVDSLFTVKTVLVKSEGDDGRPILFEKHASLPGCYSILGGKIDNIYDVLEKIDAEQFVLN